MIKEYNTTYSYQILYMSNIYHIFYYHLNTGDKSQMITHQIKMEQYALQL